MCTFDKFYSRACPYHKRPIRTDGVPLSVGPLVTSVYYGKNGRLDRDAVYGRGSGGCKEQCINGILGAVLAPPLWGIVGSQGSLKGDSYQENFVGHIVKYAVFGIKPTYNR